MMLVVLIVLCVVVVVVVGRLEQFDALATRLADVALKNCQTALVRC
jgi:hypothetical protein